MHLFTSHHDGSKRYFANFALPTHPLCWLRGHRAKAEVIEAKIGVDWLLVTCRTCGISHRNPYLQHGKGLRGEDPKEVMARQHDAARNNTTAFAKVRDGRDGYGHHTLELAVEVTSRHSYRKPGVRLHIGDRWSETPFDASFHGFKRAAYLSVGGIGNRLAHRLTRGQKRDLSIGAAWKGMDCDAPKEAPDA